MMKPGSWRMLGGLDLTTPRIMRSRVPGGLTLCINHEARDEGYRRIDGFERFDGRPAPSALPYPVEGDTEMEAEAKRAAILARRNAILEVPGQGDLLGVWRYNERTYAFRRKTTPDTEIGVWGSSASGWTELTLGARFHWNTGAGTPPAVGSVLSVRQGSGTGTATVLRLVRTAGDYSAGDAEGFCIVTAPAGVFTTGDLLGWTGRVDGTDMITVVSSVEEQSIAWDDGARFDFDNHNFYGQDNLERMYAVSGTDFGWEFDGTLWTPLITGVTQDRPIFVAAHQEHIFLAYPGGSVVHSGLGEAVNFEAISGAVEIGAGEEATGLLSGFKNSLFIYGRNQTLVLQGTSAADWNLDRLSREAGAMRGTIQMIGEPTVYDDRGVRGFEATDAFGDFSIATKSGPVRPLLDRKRDAGALPTASVRVRRKSQYRVWFDDGDCLVMGLNMGRRGDIYPNFSITRFEYLDGMGATQTAIVDHTCSVEDGDGRERIFFTIRDTGYVYEMEKGINFDGADIPAIMQLPFNDFGRPTLRKCFKRMQIEADTEDGSRFRVAADFNDGKRQGLRPDYPFEISSRGARWDEANWNEFRWSGVPESLAEFRCAGRGRNIAPLIYSRGAEIPPYVVTGITVMYTELGQMRGSNRRGR